jgi:hypothetical protein
LLHAFSVTNNKFQLVSVVKHYLEN